MAEKNGLPRVSCLMVTANRLKLASRAVRCFKNQTYPNKELVVIDDGEADYGPLLAELPADEVRYVKLEKKPDSILGKLRNRSLEEATGEFRLHWDDDDWIHPDRIQRQVDVMQQGYDAVTLHGSIMHLDTPEFFDHPYIGYLKQGWPASIMHRKDDAARFPELRKAEDSIYLQHWLQKRYHQMPAEDSYLHVRCFHGSNTWEKTHFLTKMRNTPVDLLLYGLHKHVLRNVFGHRRFKLDARARESFEMYIRDSVELGIFEKR